MSQKGFTLLELVLVLAVMAIVGALLLPVGLAMLRDADLAKAEADVQQIATALTRFYIDLRHMPACSGADCNPIVVSGPGDNNKLTFLAAGDGRGSLASTYPEERGSLSPRWNLGRQDEPNEAARNNAFNHLVENDPNADGVVDSRDYATTRSRRWKGPYLTRVGVDPWGHAYLASVGAMEGGGRPIVSGAKGWILSAGPNGIVETAPDAAVLGGDDIGVIFQDRSHRP